jgi:MEKHLA domain
MDLWVMFEPSPNFTDLAAHVRLMEQSFERILGRKLFDRNFDRHRDGAEEIFYAPFMLVSHDSQSDPIFNYGNQTALDLFEMSWMEFIKLPSRYSAPSLAWAERSLLLQTVARQGYIENYKGIRVSKSGKRFLLKNAIVWNLIDQGIYYGQGAVCREWEFMD